MRMFCGVLSNQINVTADASEGSSEMLVDVTFRKSQTDFVLQANQLHVECFQSSRQTYWHENEMHSNYCFNIPFWNISFILPSYTLIYINSAIFRAVVSTDCLVFLLHCTLISLFILYVLQITKQTAVISPGSAAGHLPTDLYCSVFLQLHSSAIPYHM